MREPMTVLVHGEPVVVTGTVFPDCPGLAITPRPGTDGWCVTHVPSGRLLLSGLTRRVARDLLRAMGRMWVDWSSAAPAVSAHDEGRIWSWQMATTFGYTKKENA